LPSFVRALRRPPWMALLKSAHTSIAVIFDALGTTGWLGREDSNPARVTLAGTGHQRANVPTRVPGDVWDRAIMPSHTAGVPSLPAHIKNETPKKVRGDRRQEWRLHCRIPHTETSSYLRKLAVPRVF
jgi:hypothetical protein